MHFMNYWDIEERVRTTRADKTPNLAVAVNTLNALMVWTNHNSDGWAYWPKPVRAADKLMTLIESVDRYDWDPEDINVADLKKALVPIKAFFTRQGADPTGVIPVAR